MIQDFAFVQVTDSWNVSVLLLMLCIGGFVKLIVESGGATAFATALYRFVTNRRRAHVAVWFSGLVIFFSDSANPLILGPLFSPLFDRLKISREKLAYLIDSTASPICILVPITSWAAYIQSLLAREYAELGVSDPPMSAFLHSIPYQFYTIAALLLVPLIGLLGIDYGPMRVAERSKSMAVSPPREAPSPSEPNPDDIPFSRAAGGIAALGTVAVVIAVALLWTGGFPSVGVFAALIAAKSVTAITYGFIAGALVLGVILLAQRAMAVRDIAKNWIRGALGMWGVLLILTLAWSLGACCDELGTGTFVAGMVERTVSPWLVPALVFLVGAAISFATGSAWGCYAILMPIALPLAVQTGLPIPVVLAAVLSGGIFGDHASPISDTTILSSTGAGCEHVAHVRTQLPYAATAAVAAGAGFLLVGVWPSAWALVPVLGLLIVMAKFFHWLSGRKDEAAPS
jgi:Na+/H+ antiporter NhaC